MDTAKLLMEFSSAIGVSGRERETAILLERYMATYGKVEQTPLGSVLCRVREPEENGVHLLLDAHMDEIGMVVGYIEDSGFLRVAACGGVDRRLLLASPVIVHGKEEPVRGVVCSIPPHLSEEGEKKSPKVEEIYIDIGCDSKEQALTRVAPGDAVSFYAETKELLGGQICGKALDNRAGCVALLKTLEYLETAPACGLSVLFSVQEEAGGAGAKTAAYALSPTHALVVDMSFGHTPDAPRERCGQMGKGPMIGCAPILSKAMTDRLAELAEREGIPYQIEAMGGATSTNADHIAATRGGVRCALLSIPEKYMHTPVETVAISDIENTAKLVCAFVKDLAAEKGER